MKDRVAWILGACTALLHLAVANRYDLFRDELSFIVCGRHPAFGFENGRTTAICRGLHPALSRIWPSLQRIIERNFARADG